MKAKHATRQIVEDLIELADALDAGGPNEFRANNFIGVRLHAGTHAAYAVDLDTVVRAVDDTGRLEFTRNQIVVVREPRAGKAGLGWLTVRVVPPVAGADHMIQVQTYDGTRRHISVHPSRLKGRRR